MKIQVQISWVGQSTISNPTYLRVHWLNFHETSWQSSSEWARPAKANRANTNNCQRIISGNREDQNISLRYANLSCFPCQLGQCKFALELSLHFEFWSTSLVAIVSVSYQVGQQDGWSLDGKHAVGPAPFGLGLGLGVCCIFEHIISSQ